MKLRLLFWQALRVASCDRAGGWDCLSSRKPRVAGSLTEDRQTQCV